MLLPPYVVCRATTGQDISGRAAASGSMSDRNNRPVLKLRMLIGLIVVAVASTVLAAGTGGLSLPTSLVAGRATSQTWPVAPGVTYSEYDRTDERGTVRVHVLSVKWTRDGIKFDQVAPKQVPSTMALQDMAKGTVAAINGDFFDIHQTGAPLGIAKDRQRGLLHANPSALTFLIDVDGTPRIRQVNLVGSIKPRGLARIELSAKNAPRVPPGAVGVYTTGWGHMPGEAVVAGASVVRQVVIKRGVVVANRTTLSPPRVALKGKVLIGRGVGADALAPLVKGLKVRVRARLSMPVQMALSGGVALLNAGAIVPTDDLARHPRTAIGIDRDKQIVHLVVVDGRSESSSGYTLVQLATLMKELGDDTAMNMDGGGSSEMVALSASGALGVRNVPSDGRERLVANGLGIFFRP